MNNAARNTENKCLCEYTFPVLLCIFRQVKLLRPMSFPHSSVGKESACNAGDPGFNSGVRKIPWRRAWQPTPVFLPGESRGQRSLAGYRVPRVRQDLATKERERWQLWVSLVVQMVKNPPAMLETWVQSLGLEDPLEEGMATHSSILAWRSSWTEEPGGPQSTGPKEPDTTEGLSHGNSIHEEAFSKKGCTVLHSTSSVRGFQCLHVFTETRCLFLCDDSCPRGCDVGSRCGFDLYFSQDCDVEGVFYVLIDRLCIFVGEMSIQIICTF